eukprot:403350179
MISDDLGSERKSLILRSKIEFYGKVEASDLMNEEQQRRQSMSQERSSLVRRKFIEKEHQLITNEINEMQNQNDSSSRLSRKDNFIDQFERSYKMQMYQDDLNQAQNEDYEDKPLDSSKLDELASNQRTVDTNRIISPHVLTSPQTYSDTLSMEIGQYQKVNTKFQYDTADQTEKAQLTMDYDVSSLQEAQNINSMDVSQHRQSKDRKSIGRQAQTQIQSPVTTSHKNSFFGQNSIQKSQVLQNSSNKKASIIQSSDSKILKNNFSKQTQIRDQQIRISFNDTVKENLKSNLLDAVQNFSPTIIDQEKVEDMILELNRLAQKSNGKIPAKQQHKIQELMNDIELQKLTYSKKQNLMSPVSSKQNTISNLSQTLRGSANAPQYLSNQKGNSTNVNSKILKDIIRYTGSKVRQTINSGKNSNRCSIERYNTSQAQINLEEANTYQIFEIENSQEIEEQSLREKSIEQIKDEMLQLLSSLNARVLQNLLKNRGSQKIRVVFERQENLLKSFSKLQIQKRFAERKELFFSGTNNSNIMLRFISDFIDLIKLIQKKFGKQNQSTQKEVQKKNFNLTQVGFFSPQATSRPKVQFNKPYYNLSPDKSDSPNILKSQKCSQNKNPHSRGTSRGSPSKDQPLTLQQQLIQQKQHALQKSYQLQLDQSISFRQKSDQAKQKELQIAKLRLQQNYLLFQLDKQEKLKQEKSQKDQEIQSLRVQSEFNAYHRQSKQDRVSQERNLVRERSIENQDFKRALRMKDLEDQLKQQREENEKSMQEYQFNQAQEQKRKQQQAEECKRKQQEILIEKVRKSEQFLNFKETELDDRLKSQFEQASYRMKKLDETENFIKKEMSMLKKIIQPAKK